MIRYFREANHWDATCCVPTNDSTTAPKAQYIIILEGYVEVRASGGESRRFRAGDILLAQDTTGEGHVSITVEPGRAMIISHPPQRTP